MQTKRKYTHLKIKSTTPHIVTSLWELDINRIDGVIIESKGREEVNEKLKKGWQLLHIYTLRYKDDDVWIERPIAIIGKSSRKSVN